MANKPNIRFKGFTDDWEQRKLGDILERRIEQRRQSADYPRLAFASGQGVIPLSERKTNNREQLTKDEFTKKYLVTEMNDIVYNPANVKYGAIDRNKFGRGLISPIYVTFTTREDAGFIERIVTSHEFQQKALRFEEGTVTKRQSVNPEDFVLLDILLASNKSEQKKVSVFFDTLDRLITLHQRKCDETKKLKKFMLQKMFPKNGEKNPEIRFAGFTDDWEQRKLGEDLESIQTGTNLLGSENNNGMPLLKMGNIQRGYFDTSKLEYLVDNKSVEPENVAYYGDFFFNTRNTMELVGKGATWTGESGKYAFNSNIARFKLKGIDTIFFNFLYNTDSMAKQVHARAMGTTSVAAIYPRSLDSIDYCLPCIDEQKRIGDYFRNLDHLITLHQRKCDKLKLIKKFMLQNMFPKKG